MKRHIESYIHNTPGSGVKKNYPVIQKEQVVLNVGAAPTEGLSNETWTFQISRKNYLSRKRKNNKFLVFSWFALFDYERIY